jgi:chemotaxis regulatin CheY-phosphate phosphatase CheZ
MSESVKPMMQEPLFDQIVALQQEKGAIEISDVRKILDGMSHESPSRQHLVLRREIETIASIMVDATHHVASFGAGKDGEAPQAGVKEANLELDEVVKTSEVSAQQILDAADEMLKSAEALGDADYLQEVVAITDKIYAACGFHDLINQRVKKIVDQLDEVEGRLMRLVKIFGGNVPEDYHPKEKKEERPDEHLMNGPQRSDEELSQDDIDALMAELGI